MLRLTEEKFRTLSEPHIKRANNFLEKILFETIGEGDFKEFHLNFEKLKKQTNFEPCIVGLNIIEDFLESLERSTTIETRDLGGDHEKVISVVFGTPFGFDFDVVKKFSALDYEIYNFISTGWGSCDAIDYKKYIVEKLGGEMAEWFDEFEEYYRIVVQKMYRMYPSQEEFTKEVYRHIDQNLKIPFEDEEEKEDAYEEIRLNVASESFSLNDGRVVVKLDRLEEIVSGIAQMYRDSTDL